MTTSGKSLLELIGRWNDLTLGDAELADDALVALGMQLMSEGVSEVPTNIEMPAYSRAFKDESLELETKAMENDQQASKLTNTVGV